MRGRLYRRSGQSILEYLVIATVIVAAIIAIRQKVSDNVSTLYDNAATKTSDAATSLGTLAYDGSSSSSSSSSGSSSSSSGSSSSSSSSSSGF